MFIKLLSEDEVNFCLDKINSNTFKGGKETAADLESIKSNKESNSVPDEVRRLITDKLYDTHYIDSVYCPTRVSVNFYNKYRKGDYYDLHVDAFKAQPKSNNIFFDYGWSINLTDDYEGGEFILDTPVGRIGKKLSAGEAVIFPIIYPHGVEKLTDGLRQNVIGWMSSNVSYEQSFMLKNMYEVNEYLMNTQKSMFTKSTLVQTYLKKAWGK
jgi:PKHD-type hydroxylase|tara:strand:+ start:4250 stop:4885 length:636 start_codon:yes stop_codon:yes gene_type:complete